MKELAEELEKMIREGKVNNKDFWFKVGVLISMAKKHET